MTAECFQNDTIFCPGVHITHMGPPRNAEFAMVAQSHTNCIIHRCSRNLMSAYLSTCVFHPQYHIVATMQSADFPTPLSQAECVSLVMAYELLRTSQSEGRNVTFLDWICLLKDSEGRDSICKFAVSSSLCKK